MVYQYVSFGLENVKPGISAVFNGKRLLKCDISEGDVWYGEFLFFNHIYF